MSYDRYTKDYRGGPAEPQWPEFAEEESDAGGSSSGGKATTAAGTSPASSGRAILAQHAGFRSRSSSSTKAQPVTRWTADEPSPVSLLVSVKAPGYATRVPGSDEFVAYAHAQGSDPADPDYPNPHGLSAPVAAQAARAMGVVRFSLAGGGRAVGRVEVVTNPPATFAPGDSIGIATTALDGGHAAYEVLEVVEYEAPSGSNAGNARHVLRVAAPVDNVRNPADYEIYSDTEHPASLIDKPGAALENQAYGGAINVMGITLPPGMVTAEMLGTITTPSGPVQLNPIGGVREGGFWFEQVEAAQPGAAANLAIGTPIPLTQAGTDAGLVAGEVFAGAVSYGAGSAGYGLVRFDGDVLAGMPNFGNTDGSWPYTFYIDDPQNGRVPLHPVGSIGPRGAFVGVNHQQVYIQLGAASELGHTGAWTNFAAGTPVHVVPATLKPRGRIQFEIDNPSTALYFTVSQEGQWIQLQRQDGSGWGTYYTNETYVMRNVQVLQPGEGDNAGANPLVRCDVEAYSSSGLYDDSKIANFIRGTEGGPMVAHLNADTGTDFTATVVQDILPPDQAWANNVGAELWRNGVVVGGPDAITFDNPATDNSDAWTYGPGVTVNDPTSFKYGADGGGLQSDGQGLYGGSDAGDATGGLPGGVLVISYGAGEVRRTLELDLRSGSYQLPPCSLVEVSAFLWGAWGGADQPAITVAAAVAPGELAQPSPMLNTAIARLGGWQQGIAKFFTPAGATHVRVSGGPEYAARWHLYATEEEISATYDADQPQANRNVPGWGSTSPWLPLLGKPTTLELISSAGDEGNYSVQFKIEP